MALSTGVLVLGLLACEIAVRVLGLAPVVGPTLTEWDPRYGKRLRASLECERATREFRMHITTNAAGRRGPMPRPGAAIVAVFGDEATLGYGVDDGLEYPRLLEAELRARGRDVDVIACAMPDDANGRTLLRLRDELTTLAPRAVVLQVSGDDFRDNVREALFTVGDAGALVERPIPSRSIARSLQSLIEAIPFVTGSHLVALLRSALATRDDGADAPAPRIPGSSAGAFDADRLTLALIDASITRCAASGIPVIVLAAGVDRPHERTALSALCERKSTPLVELPSPAVRPDHWITGTPWLGPNGHADAARRIAALLR
ncbi:MAG: hypothetical protein HZB39_08650 [Planctomycetes bacterium]|nr:hypothetical protein [Planctomycetota bacterium]